MLPLQVNGVAAQAWGAVPLFVLQSVLRVSSELMRRQIIALDSLVFELGGALELGVLRAGGGGPECHIWWHVVVGS